MSNEAKLTFSRVPIKELGIGFCETGVFTNGDVEACWANAFNGEIAARNTTATKALAVFDAVDGGK